MRKIQYYRDHLNKWEDSLEKRWYRQTVSSQRKMVVVALGIYVLLTAFVLFYSYKNPSQIRINPIQTPIVPAGSIPLKMDSMYIVK